MKALIFLFLLYPVLKVEAQEELRVFSEPGNPGYVLYASNNAPCVMSLILELTLENLRFSGPSTQVFIIPAKTDRFKLGELAVLDTRLANRYASKFRFNFGDITLTRYDSLYAYYLPFAQGKNFTVTQGYNGQQSHQNENSLDFSMPEGTEILAAREGIVVRVVQHNTQSCPEEACKRFNNYVTLLHPDGTMADYFHIRYNGSAVKPGDTVRLGGLVAYSGNTGWSRGPHLHFTCYLPGMETRRTLRTLFRVKDGTNPEYLAEKTNYSRLY